MATINMSSTLAKAKSYMGSSEGQSKVNSTVQKIMLGNVKLQSGGTVHTPEDAAAKFIDVLLRSIESSGLSPNAISAVSGLDYTPATRIGENTWLVGVYFTGDLSRPSLQEDKYGSIENIVKLLNNGVDHTMRPVHGIWHGNEVWSRTTIPGAHFVEQAVTDFMGNYASEYNVTNISIESF